MAIYHYTDFAILKIVRRVFVLFVFLFVVFGSFSRVSAQNSFASCDLCGYCPPDQPPQSWNKCKECLYEAASDDPATKETLQIDTSTLSAPTPQPGRFYTMIGCVQTDLGSFRQQGAAAGFVQKVLQIIFTLAGGLAFLYIIYGAFVILTSQADPERLNHGKRLVQGAIIGLIFSLLSVFIVNLLANGVLGIPLS